MQTNAIILDKKLSKKEKRNARIGKTGGGMSGRTKSDFVKPWEADDNA